MGSCHLLLAPLPLCLKAAFTSSLLGCRELSLEWVSGLSPGIWVEMSSRSVGFRVPPSQHSVADGDPGIKEGPGPPSAAAAKTASQC